MATYVLVARKHVKLILCRLFPIEWNKSAVMNDATIRIPVPVSDSVKPQQKIWWIYVKSRYDSFFGGTKRILPYPAMIRVNHEDITHMQRFWGEWVGNISTVVLILIMSGDLYYPEYNSRPYSKVNGSLYNIWKMFIKAYYCVLDGLRVAKQQSWNCVSLLRYDYTWLITTPFSMVILSSHSQTMTQLGYMRLQLAAGSLHQGVCSVRHESVCCDNLYWKRRWKWFVWRQSNNKLCLDTLNNEVSQNISAAIPTHGRVISTKISSQIQQLTGVFIHRVKSRRGYGVI